MKSPGASLCMALAGLGLLAATAVAQTPTFSVEAVAKNGVPIVPPQAAIEVAPGDGVTVEVFVRDWSPGGETAKGLQVVFAPDSFTSGNSGNVLPQDFATTTDLNGRCSSGGVTGVANAANAFIDTKRADGIFSGMNPYIALDSLSCGYRYAASVEGLGVTAAGVKKYCATLVVRVSDDATGKFTLRLDETAVTGTFLSQTAGNKITPFAYEPLSISVPGPDLNILSSFPPDESISARQPSETDGSNPIGIDSVQITFDGDASGVVAADFQVSVDPPGDTPGIVSVSTSGDTATLQLDSFLPTGKWTTFTHNDGTPTSVRVGVLPADVNGDKTSSALDILAVIDAINGVIVLEPRQTDVNNSGETNAQDILRVIDLLNGAGVYEVWNGRTLP